MRSTSVRSSARRSTQGVERFVYVSSFDGVRARNRVPDPPRSHLLDCPTPRSAYGFSKLARRSLRPARPTRSTDLPYRICRPFNAYGPGELPEPDEPGIAHAVPDLISQDAGRPAPASDLRVRRADADAYPCRRHCRRDRHRDGLASRARTRTSTSRPRGELTVAQITALVWQGVRQRPGKLELEHLPSFEVDVQRRWPSVEKAPSASGWEARIRLEDGLAETVEVAGEGSARSPGSAPAMNDRRNRTPTRRSRLTSPRPYLPLGKAPSVFRLLGRHSPAGSRSVVGHVQRGSWQPFENPRAKRSRAHSRSAPCCGTRSGAGLHRGAGYVAENYATGFPEDTQNGWGPARNRVRPIGQSLRRRHRRWQHLSLPAGRRCRVFGDAPNQYTNPGGITGLAISRSGDMYLARYHAGDIVQIDPNTGEVL